MVLLLINAFFVVIIMMDNNAVAREEWQAILRVCEILQSNGIAIDPENIVRAASISAMRTTRGIELEAAIAGLFLGDAKMTDQGVIYLFENPDKGTAEFYSAGDFEIRLHDGVITYDASAVRTVGELLRSMEYEKLAFDISFDEESDCVRVVSLYDNAKIFNSTIEFAFSGNSLQTVKGRYVTGIVPIVQGEQISNVSTALLEFLSATVRGDIDCYEITMVESGYQHSVVGSFGDGVMAPVWMITTDAGRYIVDSAAKEVRPA